MPPARDTPKNLPAVDGIAPSPPPMQRMVSEASIANSAVDEACGSKSRQTPSMASRLANAGILPILSEIQAQKIRPLPFIRPSTLTSDAAPAFEKPAMSLADAAAIDSSEMPEKMTSVRMPVSKYHCGVLSASPTV